MILLLRLIAIVSARLPPFAVPRRIAVLLFASILPVQLVGYAQAENSEISMRRSAERTSFTDGEITEGIVTRVESDEKNPRGGRLFVDLGAPEGQDGVVDFTLETRYGKGPKPLKANR